MTKSELHRLVDALPEQSLEAVAILLRRAQDPVVGQLDAAPYDDEDFTGQDEEAVLDGLSEAAVPWSEAGSELRAE
jgi:hypothetical protein